LSAFRGIIEKTPLSVKRSNRNATIIKSGALFKSEYFPSRRYDDRTSLLNSGKSRPLEMNTARIQENISKS
jgi:hypothetical protein